MDISRKAELYETSSGLLTITGGKLTTWRRMAKQVVDRMVEREGREAAVPDGRDPARDDGRATRTSIRPTDRRRGPLRRGNADSSRVPLRPRRARNVLRVAAERPELAGPIVPEMPDLLAEAVIAARLEQARSVADVLLRRTRLGLVAAPRCDARRCGPLPRPSAASSTGIAQISAAAEAWPGELEAAGADPAARPAEREPAKAAAIGRGGLRL